MTSPLVTVLIDTYNHERFIEEAIASVLDQGLSPAEMEVIVVDDGSTDNTPELIRKFTPRVRHIRKVNGGQASAFNAGIPETHGQIVAFLDGDDWWARNKLTTVLGHLARNPEVGAIGHGFYEVHDGSNTRRTVVPDNCYRCHLGDETAAKLFTNLRCFLGTSRVTVRKAVLDRILPVPEEVRVEADEYIFTVAPAIAPVVVLNQPLFYYRLHANNLFMIQSVDPAKLRNKHRSLAVLLRTLPEPLAQLGVSPRIIKMVLESLEVEVERMTLTMYGGKPWRTFAVERASVSIDYRNLPLGYRLFKWFVLGLTLVTPPRRFYKLRKWYAARGIRRLRKTLGEPVMAAPIVTEDRGLTRSKPRFRAG